MSMVTRRVSHGPHYKTLEKEFHQDPPKRGKADRAAAIDNLTVDHNGRTFQVDEASQDRIARGQTTAIWRMLKEYRKHSPIFNAIYHHVAIDTPVPWRDADDNDTPTNMDELSEVQEKGIAAQTAIWFSY